MNKSRAPPPPTSSRGLSSSRIPKAAIIARRFATPRGDADGRAVLHRDLFPAGARRALALAPHRCGGGLALLCRQRADPADRRRRRPAQHQARSRSRRGRNAPGDRAAARLAGGRKHRRLDAGRLHRRARFRLCEIRTGAEGLGAALRTVFRTETAYEPPPDHILGRDQAAARDQDRRDRDRDARLAQSPPESETRSRAAASRRTPHPARGCRRASCRCPRRRTRPPPARCRAR